MALGLDAFHPPLDMMPSAAMDSAPSEMRAAAHLTTCRRAAGRQRSRENQMNKPARLRAASIAFCWSLHQQSILLISAIALP